MRTLVLAILLPLAACATPPEAVQTAALDGAPEEAKTKEICWTEIVTGTRSRKQTVCRSERNTQESRDMLRGIQDHGGAAQGPPASMGN